MLGSLYGAAERYKLSEGGTTTCKRQTARQAMLLLNVPKAISRRHFSVRDPCRYGNIEYYYCQNWHILYNAQVLLHLLHLLFKMNAAERHLYLLAGSCFDYTAAAATHI
eukprot:12639-Heterococcus_DN1.PRE.2